MKEVFVSDYEVARSKLSPTEVAINMGVPLKEDGTSKDGFEVTIYRFGERKGNFCRWEVAQTEQKEEQYEGAGND